MVKDALLKNFDMTERGFRKKFRYSRPERSETFKQYSIRLCSYLNKWLTMAKVEKPIEALCDFMARDQFLEVCSRELFVHLKPKMFENLDAMAKEADLFAEARGGMFSFVNKGHEIKIIRAQRIVNLKVSRAESLKLNVAFAEKGI